MTDTIQNALDVLRLMQSLYECDLIATAPEWSHSLRQAVTDLEALTQRPAAQKVDDLHAAIMNLPCDGEMLDWANTREAYQYGHKYARHAAAELVLAHATQQATPEPPATRAQAEATDWRDRLTVNLLRQGAGLTKTQIRALIAHAVDGTEPDPALFQATPEPVGEPVGTWRVNGRMLYSDDFSHDAALKLTGDFESDEQRDQFAANVCAALNATRPAAAPAVPEGYALVRSPITEEMHAAACKVLTRSPGLDGLPQRMLDALLAAAQAKGAQA